MCLKKQQVNRLKQWNATNASEKPKEMTFIQSKCIWYNIVRIISNFYWSLAGRSMRNLSSPGICWPEFRISTKKEHWKNMTKSNGSLNTALRKPNCAQTCLACWSCQNSTLKLHRVSNLSNSITTKNNHTTGALTAIRAFGHLSSKVVAIPCVWEGVLKGTDQGRSRSIFVKGRYPFIVPFRKPWLTKGLKCVSPRWM